MPAQQLPCPTCSKLTPVSQAAYLPFCSDRCRLIDLGRWLDEEHAVPLASQDDEDQADENDADEVKVDTAIVNPLRPPINFDEPPPERAPVRLPPGWHDA